MVIIEIRQNNRLITMSDQRRPVTVYWLEVPFFTASWSGAIAMKRTPYLILKYLNSWLLRTLIP